jgi:hypothetical protein
MSIWLDDALKPELKDTFYKSNTQCYDSNWDIFAAKTLGQFFKKGIEALEEPIPASVIQQGCKYNCYLHTRDTNEYSMDGRRWSSKDPYVYI